MESKSQEPGGQPVNSCHADLVFFGRKAETCQEDMMVPFG